MKQTILARELYVKTNQETVCVLCGGFGSRTHYSTVVIRLVEQVEGGSQWISTCAISTHTPTQQPKIFRHLRLKVEECTAG